ncbi:MAG TPA: sodium/proline symporter [Thermoanaerobaculia bacterium]|nr:sodium/proline symporter [Thermoanaerobaculia bacterium]
MPREHAILVTLLVYQVALIAIGIWANRRTHDDNDFFLGGRRLGSWVAALSASASSSSAWTLLGVSGAAYAWGLSALWLFPATVSGFLINWLWVAPRLMRMSREGGSLTLTEFLAGERRERLYPSIMRLASIAILFSFLFYIASQFQAAGHAFAASFGLTPHLAIGLGVVIIVVYTLLGGFWAVSVTDTLQGLLMAAAAIFLPLVALVEVGGFGELVDGLRRVSSTGQLSLTRDYPGILGLAFILGTLGIGIGYPGQPHVVNRFMALRDRQALVRGRVIAIAWAVVIYSGMLLLGLAGHVLWTSVPSSEQIFFEAANRLLHPVLAGIMVAAVLSAIMSTADSQLLVASSSISWDWRQAGRGAATQAGARGLSATRIVVVMVSLISMLLAMFAPAAIFSRVLFAWSAMGSAFGPLLLVRLAGYRVAPAAVLTSIAAGFGLTIVAHLLPDAPGDWIERLVPFGIALLISIGGASRGARTA